MRWLAVMVIAYVITTAVIILACNRAELNLADSHATMIRSPSRQAL